MTENKRYGVRTAEMDKREATEDDVWADAYRIVEPGAVNPAAVVITLARGSAIITRLRGTDAARSHPALRAMAGQLAMLFSVDRWGASVEELDAVVRKAQLLGILHDNGIAR